LISDAKLHKKNQNVLFILEKGFHQHEKREQLMMMMHRKQ